jgi:hypothetical protein
LLVVSLLVWLDKKLGGFNMGELLTLDIPGEEKPVSRHHEDHCSGCGFSKCRCDHVVKQNNIDIASEYVASGRW